MKNYLRKGKYKEEYKRYTSQREIVKTLIKGVTTRSWKEFVDKMDRNAQVTSNMYKTLRHAR